MMPLVVKTGSPMDTDNETVPRNESLESESARRIREIEETEKVMFQLLSCCGCISIDRDPERLLNSNYL